ncbi:hypothetical protein AgCh_016730 [Apium graveolens]
MAESTLSRHAEYCRGKVDETHGRRKMCWNKSLKDSLEAARYKEEEKKNFWQKAGVPALVLRVAAPGEQKVSAPALVKRTAALGRDIKILIQLQFDFLDSWDAWTAI